jgi:hypothetical protein
MVRLSQHRGSKMRKLTMTIGLLSLLGAWPNQGEATDLAVKARPIAYPYMGSGCYFGVNAEGGAAQSNVSGNGLFLTGLASGNMIAAGGSVGGSVGCIYGNGTNWVAVQGNLNYQNITGAVEAPGGSFGVSSKWQASQVVKFGGFPALLSWLPNLGLNFPVLAPPANAPVGLNIVTLTSQPYVMVGAQEFDNSGWFQAQSGHSVGVAPLVGAGVINQITDTSGKPSGAVLDTYAKVVFAGKGFTINDVGSNPNLGAAANLGTQYFAGVAIYY